MTVAELVEYLKTCPQDFEVWLWTEGHGVGNFERMTYQDVSVRNGRVETG